MNKNVTKSTWYADGLRFACTRCGNCCGGAPGYVWVSHEEMVEIARFCGMPLAQFQQQHVRRIGLAYSLLELENGDCEFLIRTPDGLSGCSIHPVRPLQCRTWPFWGSNLESRRSWSSAAKHCPGMNQGDHYPLEVIQDCLRRNDEAELPL